MEFSAAWAASSSAWSKLTDSNGKGTAVCNSSEQGHFSCFALRCGKGRGLEFAFLFSGGDTDPAQAAQIWVDDQYFGDLQPNVINPNAEIVFPYVEAKHKGLIRVLKSGTKVSLWGKNQHVFGLRQSSRQIERVFRQCAGVINNAGGEVALSKDESSSKGINIQLLFNTDLPGNDYANGLRQPELAGISRDQCADICVADQRCRAYTHNGSNSVCILKNGVGSQQAFAGATSGIISGRPLVSQPSKKVALAPPSRSTFLSADIKWQKDDTPADFINRVRDAAKPMGEKCSIEAPKIAELQKAIAVKLETPSTRIGKASNISWSGAQADNALPLYLFISTKSAVRFAGEGAYVLTPNATAPFGIRERQDSTRAIIPLFGFGHDTQGSVNIEPVFAGQHKLNFSVAAYQRACGKTVVHEIGSATLVTRPPSLPKVELDDRLVETAPESYVVSPDNSRLIEVRGDDTWRLLNAADRSVILDVPGINPRFSETGRFISVGGYESKQIFDSLDGKMLADNSANDVSWANNDSFIVFSTNKFGRLSAQNTLNTDISFTGGGELAPRSSGFENGVRFDQENGFFIDNAWSAINISRLHKPSQMRTTPGKRGRQKKMAKDNLGQFFLAAPLSLPEEWVLIGGIKAPQRVKFPDETDADYLANVNSPFNGGVTLPTRKVLSQTLKTAALKTSVSQTRTVRTILTEKSVSQLSKEQRLRRLRDFGLPVTKADDVSFEGYAKSNLYRSHGSAGPTQIEFGKSAFKKILKDVPALGNSIPATDDYWACGGRALDYARKHIVNGKPLWVAQFVCTDGALDFYQEKFYLIHNSGPNGQLTLDLRNPDSTSGVACSDSLAHCANESAVFGGSKLLIWSKFAGGFALVDGNTFKVEYKQFDLPRGHVIDRMALLDDGEHVLQLNTDGTFFVHRLSLRKHVLSGRVVDDEVVIWTDNLQFDATPEGAHLVNLKFDGLPGKYTFQQFDARLKIDGLLKAVLSKKTLPRAPEIDVPPTLSGSINLSTNGINGVVIPASFSKIRSVRVYQDGILTHEEKVVANSAEMQVNTPRLAGVRWVSMVAVDESGLVSLPLSIDLGVDKTRRSTVRLLAVGIDQYDDERVQDLNFAEADANTLAGSLQDIAGKTINLEQSSVLSNEAATTSSVLDAARKLVSETQLGEQAVFFFAGHGVKGEDGRYYMATPQIDVSNISGTALSWDKLASILAQSKGRITVIIDACHSGAAGTDFFATNDEAATGILKNIPTGLTVLAASKGRELSEESSSISGGFFTRAVADVISGSRTQYDTNRNGRIEVSELYQGVKSKVSQNTNGRQTPSLARNQMVGDFSLF